MSSRDLTTITPTIAQALLDKNSCGRPLDRKLVKEYARRILSGEWQKFPEDQMARDDLGNLIDGQHRNSAIVETGISLVNVPLLTVSDEDR